MSSASAKRYAALLRGVNVGRHNRLSMTDLRAVLTRLECTDVSTVLQSGNAVLSSTRDADDLTDLLGRELRTLMEKDIGVIVRDVSYFEGVVAGNPFATLAPDGDHVGATFLAGDPEPGSFEASVSEPPLRNANVLGDRVIYTYAPLLGDADFPEWTKLLKQTVTTRNWRTTTRILRALRR